MGLRPGCLSNEINLHAMNDSRDSEFFLSSKHSLLENSANILRSSDDAVPNECDVRIFFPTNSVKAR